ncbi:MAG TPA: Gfo/Idh/MocA family oxidoreductase [Acidobacteriaceae bacterium]|jgi:predicted dehydrogenase|nr:Gfo/Idh/MocA family oxidoreductase [Acidobacteriaceae bacterium]
MTTPIRTAIVGTGFMGRVHLEALRRVEHVEVAAIVGRNPIAARQLGSAWDIPRLNLDAVLADPSIAAVHLCTPNAAHFPMAKQALLAGKHVLCEKPLATSAAEAQELVTLAAQRNVRNGVCHNLRYYPMVQQMRALRESGALGEIFVVQGTYSQDWLLYDTDWNWRVTSRDGGPSRCMADIGSHWFDMAEHLTGLRVSSLCADLQTFHETRKQPRGPVETFANKLASESDTIETPVDTEDMGAVIFRMGHARGAMTASQVSAGRKNRLSIEIYGSKAGIAWDQERPDELWVGRRDSPNRITIKDPSLLEPTARTFADLPGGHSEGYDDTFKQVFRRFYASIADPTALRDYPQFADGLRQLVILEAELASAIGHLWVNLNPPDGPQQ